MFKYLPSVENALPTAPLDPVAYSHTPVQRNKGYPTKKHREAIKQHGITPYHRKSYNLLGDGQLSIDFGEF